MLTAIIFSRSRPMQLDLLLHSIQQNFAQLTDIHVLVKIDNDEYRKGYLQLVQDYPHVAFLEETNFEQDLAKLMDKCKEYIVFFTDDSFLYRKVPYNPIPLDDNIACFSLRLGMNIASFQNVFPYKDRMGNVKECYNTLTDENILDIIVKYDFKRIQSHDYFGYPLSVDGHIFKTSIIKPIVLDTKSSFPNELEGRMAGHGYRDNLPDYMSCFGKSCLVISPVNRVQDKFTNAFGEKYPHTPEELNKLFLDGYRIKLDHENLEVNQCHQEIDYKFEKVK